MYYLLLLILLQLYLVLLFYFFPFSSMHISWERIMMHMWIIHFFQALCVFSIMCVQEVLHVTAFLNGACRASPEIQRTAQTTSSLTLTVMQDWSWVLGGAWGNLLFTKVWILVPQRASLTTRRSLPRRLPNGAPTIWWIKSRHRRQRKARVCWDYLHPSGTLCDCRGYFGHPRRVMQSIFSDALVL